MVNDTELAKEYRDFEKASLEYADDRLNKVSDSLAGKMLQISTIIFSFSTAFLTQIIGVSTILIKIFFSVGLFLLLISIVFGIIHEYVRRDFWKGISRKRHRAYSALDRARREKISLKEAFACCEEIFEKKNGLYLSSERSFVVQIILLICGALGILTSIILKLF